MRNCRTLSTLSTITQILFFAAAIINNADFLRIASEHPDPKISDSFFLLFAQVLRGLIVAHRDLGPKENAPLSEMKRISHLCRRPISWLTG